MSQYATIKAIIDQVVTTNGQQEITGALLNEVLKAMVNSLGSDYQYGGVVVPSSNVGTPDQNVFYAAIKAGTYTNFGNVTLPAGLTFLRWNGSWGHDIIFAVDNEPRPNSNNLVRSGGVAELCGYYDENPQFMAVCVSKNGKILSYVTRDGLHYFYNLKSESLDAISNQLQLLFAGKVNVEPGKSLIDENIADSLDFQENEEFIAVNISRNRKILSYVTRDGSHYFYNLKSESLDAISNQLQLLFAGKVNVEPGKSLIDENIAESLDFQENEEFIAVNISRNGKIISYVTRDGSHYFYNLKSESLDEIRERIEHLNLDITILEKLLNWKNKTLWWCGTSIPAAGFWNVNNTFAYPYMVGQNINALRVFNEAVGSSQAIRLVNAESYEVVSRRMGNSIADALAICADLWSIDDANHTVTAGPRTIGISAIPNVTTYEEACYQRYLLLSNGYEIKLVSKYLISDPTENEQFLRQKFGNLYNVLVSLHPNGYNYQSNIDVFVIDHGHNDGPHPVSAEYVDSTDMSTFIGAINTYIRLIMAYKPHARIVILSDYDNAKLTSETIEAQAQIADHWHLPFLNLTKHLPFTINTKVKVRGYWNTSGFWIDTGFTYNPNAQTIAEAFSENGDAYMNPYLGDTISAIAQHITPEQDSNGVWWYYLEPRYIWIKDGLHPHTDRSGRCLHLYAKIIAEFINHN